MKKFLIVLVMAILLCKINTFAKFNVELSVRNIEYSNNQITVSLRFNGNTTDMYAVASVSKNHKMIGINSILVSKDTTDADVSISTGNLQGAYEVKIMCLNSLNGLIPLSNVIDKEIEITNDKLQYNLYSEILTKLGLLNNYIGVVETNSDYFTTDYIPVDEFALYLIIETQNVDLSSSSPAVITVCGYNIDKGFVNNLYMQNRYYIDTYKHSLEIPKGIKYIKASFIITDTKISIVKTRNPIEKSYSLFYSDSNSFTQGMCVSDDYAFISVSTSKGGNPNDYVIRKVRLSDGQVVKTGDVAYNHANGMAYNPTTNELIVCALNGASTQSTSSSDDDYCLYVVDADDLTLKEKITLKETILDVCSNSVGISGVAYNKADAEYYVLTRYPKRYIVVLDADFSIKRYFYVKEQRVFENNISDGGTIGDICTDSKYVYIPSWRVDIGGSYSIINEIDVYSIDGNYIGTYNMNGISHIESIDINNGVVYTNYIDFNVNPYTAKTYKSTGIYNIADTIPAYLQSIGIQLFANLDIYNIL